MKDTNVQMHSGKFRNHSELLEVDQSIHHHVLRVLQCFLFCSGSSKICNGFCLNILDFVPGNCSTFCSAIKFKRICSGSWINSGIGKTNFRSIGVINNFLAESLVGDVGVIAHEIAIMHPCC